MTEVLDDRDREDDVVAEPADALEPAEGPRTKARRRRRWARGGSLVVDLHNVMGLFAAVAIIVVSATGILLNHLELFGVTRPTASVEQQRPPLQGALPVDAIVSAAQQAELRSRGGAGETAELDRAVWSPGDGTVDVRLEGDPATSVIVDAATAEVIDQVERHDLDVTAAHSGELIAKPWVILSDIVALILIISVVTGVIVWVRRVRSRGRRVGARGGSRWIRANWWFHLVGGLAAAAYLVVMSVTGVLLNHKQPLGYMAGAPELAKRADDFRPLPVAEMVGAAIAFRNSPGIGIENVKSVDYRPKGYAKVRFDDDDYEVIVDAADGSVESASRRWDIWIEDLHSGLLFGSKGWLLADIPAAIAILLALNGAYLWTRPGWRARDNTVRKT